MQCHLPGGPDYRNVVRENEISSPGANGVCLLGSKLMHPLFNGILIITFTMLGC